MKGEVTGHYVAVKPDRVKKRSEGGIVLPEEFDDNKKNRVEQAGTTGVVVGIGPMAWKAYDGSDPDWKPWAEVGDRVWHQRHVAKIIEDKGDLDEDGKPQKIFIMADENIIFNEGKADE